MGNAKQEKAGGLMRANLLAILCCFSLQTFLTGAWSPIMKVAIASDVFLLENGGRIEGKWVPPFNKPPTVYIIETNGGKVAISSEQVKEIVKKSRDEELYEKFLPKMPNNADGNWIMAEWCSKHSLHELRRRHLRAVLKYEPDHEEARRILGYTRVKGRWFKGDDRMTAQGMERHNGEWRYPQDIKILDAKEDLERRQKEVGRQVKTWRRWLNTRRSEEGLTQLRAINDPLAVPALVELLLKEKDDRLKLLYIERLGELRHLLGVAALVQLSLDDNHDLVREACLDELEKFGTRSAIDAYLLILNGVGKQTLAAQEQFRINRAGVGLARMKDPSVIPQLIDALITEYKFKVGGSGANTAVSFNQTGGFSMGGGQRAKIRKQKFVNKGVLDALTMLSDKNFGSDQERWRAWYAHVTTPQNVNLRRDD